MGKPEPREEPKGKRRNVKHVVWSDGLVPVLVDPKCIKRKTSKKPEPKPVEEKLR